MFWSYSIFFEPGQIFLSMVKSDIWPYNFGYLTIFKNIEQDQKILNTFKKEFELADGLGSYVKFDECQNLHSNFVLNLVHNRERKISYRYYTSNLFYNLITPWAIVHSILRGGFFSGSDEKPKSARSFDISIPQE